MLSAVVAFGIASGFAIGQTPVPQKPAVQNPAVQPGAGVKNTMPTWGKITKVNNNAFTWQQYDPVSKMFLNESKQIPIDPNSTALKFYTFGQNKYAPLQDGLKSPTFTTIGPDGVFAGLGMDGKNLNQVFVYPNQASFQQGMQTFPATGAIPGIPAPTPTPAPGSGK
jgi:hypothetical protein